MKKATLFIGKITTNHNPNPSLYDKLLKNSPNKRMTHVKTWMERIISIGKVTC